MSSNLAVDLEIALRRILSRCRFLDSGNLGVSNSGSADQSYLIAIADLEAARTISGFLGNPPHLRINSDPVVWTLSPDQAREIDAASRSAPDA